jgi:hypothetical protein
MGALTSRSFAGTYEGQKNGKSFICTEQGKSQSCFCLQYMKVIMMLHDLVTTDYFRIDDSFTVHFDTV